MSTAEIELTKKTSSKGRTFVLVHGAWYGAWVWKHVAPALRSKGHQVWTPTLTGLGARKHLASFPYDLGTHIDDIAQLIEMEDLQDIDLVGWSYGGMVTTGVLSRLSGRIRSMIYLDAFVPEPGKAVVDYLPTVAAETMRAKAAAGQDVPPPPLAMFGVDESASDIIAYVQARTVNQSARCFTQPSNGNLRHHQIPCSYVQCTTSAESRFTQFMERAREDSQFETHSIAASHLCMLTDSETTTELLLSTH